MTQTDTKIQTIGVRYYPPTLYLFYNPANSDSLHRRKMPLRLMQEAMDKRQDTIDVNAIIADIMNRHGKYVPRAAETHVAKMIERIAKQYGFLHILREDKQKIKNEAMPIQMDADVKLTKELPTRTKTSLMSSDKKIDSKSVSFGKSSVAAESKLSPLGTSKKVTDASTAPSKANSPLGYLPSLASLGNKGLGASILPPLTGFRGSAPSSGSPPSRNPEHQLTKLSEATVEIKVVTAETNSKVPNVKIDTDANLNILDDKSLAAVKKQMDISFNKTKITKDDPAFIFDVKKDFVEGVEANEWDSDKSVSGFGDNDILDILNDNTNPIKDNAPANYVKGKQNVQLMNRISFKYLDKDTLEDIKTSSENKSTIAFGEEQKVESLETKETLLQPKSSVTVEEVEEEEISEIIEIIESGEEAYSDNFGEGDTESEKSSKSEF